MRFYIAKLESEKEYEVYDRKYKTAEGIFVDCLVAVFFELDKAEQYRDIMNIINK